MNYRQPAPVARAPRPRSTLRVSRYGPLGFALIALVCVALAALALTLEGAARAASVTADIALVGALAFVLWPAKICIDEETSRLSWGRESLHFAEITAITRRDVEDSDLQFQSLILVSGETKRVIATGSEPSTARAASAIRKALERYRERGAS